jgi:hypothetical protein
MSNEIVKGYKATDKNMQCRGFQFELGVWHKHNGEIAMCESGFHFCEYPSGPWAFYSDEGTRIFKVEAKNIIKGEGPGADLKHVAMEIRLVEEIIFTGYRNTGDMNTGDMNTGYRNTGDMNTGDRNTGDMNTGYRNTGDMNTGYRNTGDMNTGDMNTGDGNATDKCSGYLCIKKQSIVIFDKKVKDGTAIDWSLVSELSGYLMEDKPFDVERFLSIPNATKPGIEKLHAAHIARRKLKP